MPVFYECQRCTACCRWPGQVRVTEVEIRRLAEFLGLDEFTFIQRYCRLAADRRGLVLEEKPDGSCVFLEGRDCRVQPVKPQQCRDFPNWWRFPGFEAQCRARPRPLDAETYLRAVAEATGRSLEEVKQRFSDPARAR
ncbi:YkgJ family cysteine cluster protein [Limisphaera sp. VF-2]|jgi:Fe-S-cluster containining protein|uniref:YkgJ family cysteine cluster protein n=1 Tax=Limisphaera sp. VF-2 TaxID=3400418 RepID=UPI0017545F20|nr:YkgJ family cysteine cluster protein [Limisphaera sp.]